MRTLDINTNYSDHGGGIRTYHQAKIAWFNRQRDQRYYLVVPGARRRVQKIGPRAVRIEVWGPAVGSGYRFMLDYAAVLHVVRRLRPEVVEAGDPFLTGLVLLAARRWGWFRGWLTAFYHSDPIETWVVPWARRGGALRRGLARLVGRAFYAAQRRYDLTVVTSRTMERHLRSQGVARLVRKPLGVDPLYLEPPTTPAPAGGLQGDANSTGRLRLLFVGRLVADKAADLLWQALPRLLELPGAELTVIGGGPMQPQFAGLRHPGYRFLGYVADRRQLAQIYQQHDVLLAPGPYETFGLAVLEALASGLVVVGPDRGGTAELLAELHSPFVFRAGDVDGFVRAAERTVAADLADWSRRARELAGRYGTWDQAIARLMATYCQLGHERPAPRPFWRRTDKPQALRPAAAEALTSEGTSPRAAASRAAFLPDPPGE